MPSLVGSMRAEANGGWCPSRSSKPLRLLTGPGGFDSCRLREGNGIRTPGATKFGVMRARQRNAPRSGLARESAVVGKGRNVAPGLAHMRHVRRTAPMSESRSCEPTFVVAARSREGGTLFYPAAESGEPLGRRAQYR